jgi:hypothetical protein
MLSAKICREVWPKGPVNAEESAIVRADRHSGGDLARTEV